MSSQPSDTERPAVLLVDDHEENLVALKAVLSPLGHRLVTARSGRAALEAVRSEQFAVILLDMRMPDMDGVATARAIKAIVTPIPPILFLTAETAMPNPSAPYLAGGVDVISKPFNIEALRTKIGVYVELWRLRRQNAARADTSPQLRFISDAVPALIAYIDRNEVYRLCNATYERWFGVPSEAIVGRTLREVLGPDAYAVVQPHVATALRGELATFEGELPYALGGGRWVQATYTPERGPDGDVEGFVVLVYDLSERRRAEMERAELLQKVEASEARFRRLHECGVIGIVFWSRDGGLVDANDAFLEMVGYSRQELVQGAVRWRDMTPPEYAELDDAAFAEMEQKGFCTPFEKVYLHKAGHRVPVLLGAACWEGSTSEGVAWIVDISDRKREERRRELVAAASRIFAAAVDSAAAVQEITALFVQELADGAAAYLIESDGAVTLAACKHTDAATQAALRALHEDCPPGGRGSAPHLLAIARGQRELVSEVSDAWLAELSAGDQRWLSRARELGLVSVLSVPMISQGKPLGALTLASCTEGRRFGAGDALFVEEVARRAAAAIEKVRLFQVAQEERRRADEANRAKDEFLAVVSHELRTPLNAMLGWAKLLSGGSLRPEQATRAVQSIERNAILQAQLIEDLLDISRIITGKLRLELSRVDMAAVIDAAMDVVSPAAAAKGIQVEKHVDAGASELIADPNRLQQAVWNLISNAVKFTDKGGRVLVRVDREEELCRISVEDTGRGVPADFLPFVFDRFRQAEMGTARAHGGLGLGLAIARHIAELHGGSAEAYSPGLGYGATFTLKLPLSPVRASDVPLAGAAAGPPLRAPATPIRCPPALAGATVLVIDDEADARDVIAALFEHCEADVVTAASAEEGLRLIGQLRPALIVCDLAMPGQDGLELIAKVRALPAREGGRTPAIALTAHARTSDRTRALLAGFDRHVSKPVNPPELLEAAESLSASWRANQREA